jgi:uncharacterized protein (UPF0332 family)
MIYNNEFVSFKPVDYYKIAKDLYDNLDYNNPDTATVRTIISRAYYAAFLQVRQYLRENTDHTFKDGREHSKVLNIIEKEKPIISGFFCKTLYDNLYALERNRVHCDYKFEKPYVNKWSKKPLNDLLDHSDWIITNVPVNSFYDEE